MWAAVIAWKSPVKWRFICSIGTTWAYPPPAAPPFIPKHGPRLGSLRQTIDFFPILFRPSFKPTDVVVLPSPAGVGLIAVTSINFPSGLDLLFSIKYQKMPLRAFHLIQSQQRSQCQFPFIQLNYFIFLFILFLVIIALWTNGIIINWRWINHMKGELQLNKKANNNMVPANSTSLSYNYIL